MKKLQVALLLCLSITANAQIVDIGITSGASISSITPKSEGHKNKLGVKIGVIANTSNREKVAILHEVSFINKGVNVEYAYTDKNGIPISDFSENISLNYIEINPVLLGPDINGLRIVAGPQVGILTNNVSGINDFDFAVNINASYEFEFGGYLSVFYSRSFVSISKENKLYNQSFGVSLGYIFKDVFQ